MDCVLFATDEKVEPGSVFRFKEFYYFDLVKIF
jgi:hypothetical protein